MMITALKVKRNRAKAEMQPNEAGSVQLYDACRL
jgi:hypothetical protein